MSRTDKDRPHWLGDWYKPRHRPGCVGNKFGSKYLNCDLPEHPPVRHRWTGCYWDKIQINGRFWWQDPPPRWYIDHVWTNVERVRWRDYATEAIKEYQANGELESTFQNYQHGHGAKWYWW